MARTNKYASLNFNDIYEKKIINNPSTNKQNPHSSSSSLSNPNKTKTILSNSRIHGNMLVLTRPTPKPIPPQPSPTPTPTPQLQQTTHPVTPDQTRIESDSISLRPLGRTGSGLSISPSPVTSPLLNKERELSVSPKPDKFVPPHLRPGSLCKEEKPGPEFHKQPLSALSREFAGYRQGQFGFAEEGRPKSGGGGYERVRRGGGSDLVEMNRPGSSGSRPTSSG